MPNIFYQILQALAISTIAAWLVTHLLLRYQSKVKLNDIPSERKLHVQPVPVIGGIIIATAMIVVMLLVPSVAAIAIKYITLAVALVTLLITGVLDDKLNLPASIRFGIECLCAYAVARSGIRLTSLHGIWGITQLPVMLQYIITILLIVGVTNAFNLLDGIDGLAGAIAFINILLLSGMYFAVALTQWLPFFTALAASILVFLRFNWRPAKLFMGDAGSLTLGFLMVSLGILLIETTYRTNTQLATKYIVLLAAAFMVPVIDTFRVAYVRLKRGRSPFSADKNHLHHWLLKQRLLHNQATSRVVVLHIILLFLAYFFIQWFSITTVIFLLMLVVAAYTRLLQLNSYFQRWYRFIKQMETSQE